DAFAIILAAEHPSFNLLGISTVHGNAPMDRVTLNAISLLTSIGRTEIPVYAGARKPFMRPAVHAPDIHGSSGIDGTDLLPEVHTAVQSENCILAMRAAIMATPLQTCVLVATGTLTNVALLFATFPEVVAHLKAVSIMGGAFGTRSDAHGNISKHAEFNIFCDPEAAQSVLANPELDGRITLIPLDLTHTVPATPEILSRLRLGRDDPGNLRQMLYELLTYFSATYERVFGLTQGPPLHDPLAVAALLPTDEIAWEVEEYRVEVVCHGDEIGKTIKTPVGPGGGLVRRETGLGGVGKEKVCRVKIPSSVDVDAFWNVILKMVEMTDGRYVWP
ncbi:Inosine/uridine-preferring nucleoside hydrolase domain-containing protein, partial [Geopyxis carbonaria]